MIYTIDTSSFIVLGHYFPSVFQSFWIMFNSSVNNNQIISTREVFRELDNENGKDHLRNWVFEKKYIFRIPSNEELAFVSEIFKVPHFQQLLKQKQLLTSGPAADPFIIASAKINNACVVTEELNKKNSAKIPTVCEHFGIDCINLEELMAREHWTF
jgi:hypothetical protein